MIKTLLKSLREYKKSSVLTTFFISLEVVVECFIPFITAKLITAIEVADNLSDITKYGLILIGLSIAALLCGTLSGYFCAVASAGFSKNLRYDMFRSVQKFSFSNIDKFSTSSIITRLTTDVSYVQMAYMMVIRVAIRGPLMIIFALVMAIAISPSLSVVFAFILPFLAIGLGLIIYRAMPLFNSVFKKLDILNESIQENISGMRVVKAYVREDFEKKKFGKASDEVAKDFTKAEKIVALNNPLMSLSIHVVVLVICYFGSKMIITGGALEIGEFSALITYGVQILISLMMFSMVIVMITISAASANRIAEVLRESPDIVNPKNAVTEVPDGSIVFNSVSFRYSEKADRMALSGVDFSLESGQTLGIIGGTGTGKSSLVQLIPRLYDASEGTVSVGGINVKEYDLETLRDNVAFVLQKNVLFSGTVKENLRWGNEYATDEEMINACKMAKAHDFIDTFADKYDHHVEQGGTNLSGGQRQRLCIARALLKNPKILILDDSTSAVDTKTDMLIRTALKEEIPQVTKIIIAQRITSVSHADKIIVMDGGSIDAVGTHDELLLSNDIYKEVYESQIKGTSANE